jgi:hypothetical protein
VIAFLRARRTAVLAVFMLALLAVLLFIGAQHAWPRSVPEAFGWAVYYGSWPWSLPWLGDVAPTGATVVALACSFALNVTLAVLLVWFALSRRATAGGGR